MTKQSKAETISPQKDEILLTCGHFVKSNSVNNKTLLGQSIMCKLCGEVRSTVGQIGKILTEDHNTATVVIVSKIVKPVRRMQSGE